MNPMTVADVMSADVHTCHETDTCERAAGIMWDHDCGIVPILDSRGHPIGMITDRDICMAAYTQGKPLWMIPVTAVSSRRVVSVHPEDPIATAEDFMSRHRVRRLAVIDRGGNLVGVVSLADILRRAGGEIRADDSRRAERIVSTLAEVLRSQRCVPALNGNARHADGA